MAEKKSSSKSDPKKTTSKKVSSKVDPAPVVKPRQVRQPMARAYKQPFNRPRKG